MQIATEDVSSFEKALGALLIERGKLDPRALDRAMRVRRSDQEGLTQLLPKLGLVSERDIAEALSEQLSLPLVTAQDYPTLPLLEGKVSVRFLHTSRVLPLAETAEGLVLAMADPLDRYAIDAMRLIAAQDILPRVAVPAEIEAAAERLYAAQKSPINEMIEAVGEEGDEAIEYDVERLRDLASEAPVIRLVNHLVTKAVEARASDIHIEPWEDKLRVRFRIDGVLRDIDSPPDRFRAAVISRVKLMAKLNIAERRLPQDGRIKLAVRGTPIDFRVASIPTMHGESVVLRVLDRESVALDFAAIGIDGEHLRHYLDALERPNGILLVTGPTGSGKTTTLYTSLVRLNTAEKKILTVEDPIEYQLEGINQIQVKQSIGLSFANILRSILRHDPDIIMVGEIRDLETAEIAVQAALTGHLVLSTLHTNDAAGSITRLLDMGVADYLLTSVLNGVVGQRLVRTLCPQCRQPYRAMPELVDQLKLPRYAAGSEFVLCRASGCEACNGTGYFGRTSIFEMLVVTDTLRRLILRHAESNELHRAAVEEGMRTMYDDGMMKALAGETTIEEVLKVTHDK
ncbi:MAG: ral secretion pathway protein [Rhodospirillaceae bacterium]|jgi:general secretion pathway protein E|nr:ral secretion pathway protein [Rhodospirillaceae bacterium]